jgi:glycosyltransferase involved in cell wall biosynthesis
MTPCAGLGLSPYDGTSGPPPGSVPVAVIVLAKDEEPNIERCLASAAWAAQRIVVDSGSRDATRELARRHGAHVVRTGWRGFAGQREWALRLFVLRHDWVFFLDADEWVSTDLAAEIDRVVGEAAGNASAYRLRYRLVFAGRWIRHCGWYRGSWIVRLMRRSRCGYRAAERFAERVIVDGPIGTLRHDLVDEDRKGVAAWMRKHVGYAELEAARRSNRPPLRARIALLGDRRRGVAWVRYLLKEVVYPAVPGKPLALFGYMYLIRLGFLDGRAGLRFCLLHAWHEHNVGTLLAARRRKPSATRMSSHPRPRETVAGDPV